MPITITNESIYGKPQPVEPARIQVSQPQPEVDPFLPAIEAVQKAGDSLTKEKALLDLTNQYGEFESQKMKQFHDIAYGRFGVSGLERQLKFSEQKDRSHPMWLQYQTDSEETARARAMYDKSISLAESHLRELAVSDPDITKTKQRIGGFMKMQERLLNTMLQKEGIQNEKVDQITSVLNPDNMAAIQALYPTVKDPQELKLRAAQLITNPQFRDEAAVIMDPAAKPQDFLTAAVHGISKAVPYVVARQTALTGQEPTAVEAELAKMRALVINPKALQTEADKFLSAQEKLDLGNLQQRATLAKDKESLAKLEALKVDTAIKIMRAVKKNSLLGNAESWQPVDGMRIVDLPEFDSYKANKKPISVETIYREFVRNAPKEARSTRAALVQQHLFANANKLNGTLYGDVISMDALKAKTQALSVFGPFEAVSMGIETALTMPNALTIGPVF